MHAIVGTSPALGIRHGIDWDHIAAITDITSTSTAPADALDARDRLLSEEPVVQLTDERYHALLASGASRRAWRRAEALDPLGGNGRIYPERGSENRRGNSAAYRGVTYALLARAGRGPGYPGLTSGMTGYYRPSLVARGGTNMKSMTIKRSRPFFVFAVAASLAIVLATAPTPGAGYAPAQAARGVLREFTLVAEPVRWEIQPGLIVDGWGYNGGTPGPTIRVTEGDRVRVTLVNRLPVPTTSHWHGIDVPVAQDGVPGLSQAPVEPGATFVYEFTATNPGSRWYHSHVDSNMQIQLGLFGAFIIDPKVPEPVRYDREYTYLLSEKALDVTPAVAMGEADVRNRDAGNGRGGAFTPDLFLMNGRAGTSIDELRVREGERVRIRLVNVGNLVHTMHTHGHSFKIIATDGNPVPPAAQLTKDTVLIGPAERYDLEVTASNPGIWMFHCHINNHSANGMVTALAYEGAEPLAGGDHSAAHGPVATPAAGPTPPPSPSPSARPVAGPSPAADHAGQVHPPAGGAGAPAATATAAPAAPDANGSALEVKMLDDRFVTARATVKAGTTVTWLNAGNNFHDTTSMTGDWTSGSFPRGEHFSFTFDEPGVYQYICRQHFLQGMRGTITVEE